jgi:polysaccharide biosynthesis transport protein
MRTHAPSRSLENSPDWSHEFSNHVDPAAGRGAIDFRSLALILRWRIGGVVAITVATIVAAIAFVLLVPPNFRATAVILVDPRQANITKSEAVLSGIGSDAAAVESQVELITSVPIIERAVERLGLLNDPGFVRPSMSERLFGWVQSSDEHESGSAISRRAVERFRRVMSVRRRGLTYVIEITTTAGDAERAALFANTIAELYIEDQHAAKTNITRDASVWLTERIEEMRVRVRRSEDAVEQYRTQNNVVTVTQGNRLIARQIEDLHQQIALARTRVADAEARLRRTEEAARRNGDPATLSEALNSPVVANLRAQYTTATGLEAEQSALYGSRHPALIATRAQIRDVRRQIDEEIGRVVSGVRNEYQTALNRAASLETELSKLKQQSTASSEADVKLRELEREAQADRTLLEQFLGRVKETTEQQTLQKPDARIISNALPPGSPNRPPLSLLLMAAGVVGLFGGVAYVLVREQMRGGFRQLSEVTQALRLRALGAVPNWNALSPRRGLARLFARRRNVRETLAGAQASQKTGPYGSIMSAIRAQASGSRGDVGQVVAVMSAVPGEGKTTFAYNYAKSAADAGLRTLLIDTDIYTATLTRGLGVTGPGLAEVLAGLNLSREAIANDGGKLSVLGVRALDSEPPGELDGARFATLLREKARAYQLIVVDTPPILPMGGLPPHLEHVDSGILVVEWNRTPKDTVMEALGLLTPAWNDKLRGVVLNKMSAKWWRLSNYGSYFKAPDKMAA